MRANHKITSEHKNVVSQHKPWVFKKKCSDVTVFDLIFDRKSSKLVQNWPKSAKISPKCPKIAPI